MRSGSVASPSVGSSDTSPTTSISSAEPQYGTARRLDVLDISKRDITEQGKRLFVNAITVRVSSEIAPSTFNKLYKVQEINVTGTTGTQVIGRGTFTAVDPFTIPTP